MKYVVGTALAVLNLSACAVGAVPRSEPVLVTLREHVLPQVSETIVLPEAGVAAAAIVTPASGLSIEDMYPDMVDLVPAIWAKHFDGETCEATDLLVIFLDEVALGRVCGKPGAAPTACALMWDDTIAVDAAIPFETHRYTLRTVLAHELAHVCEYRLDRPSTTWLHNDPRVWGASGFVADLIVSSPDW